jgi:3-isopropylmalate dehydrogenase
MAAGMMLDYLGESDSANRIESSVEHLLASGQITSLDATSGLSTTQIGDMVVGQVRKSK